MTKYEKLEKAMTDHAYALQRISELERQISDMRFTVRSQRQELNSLKGIKKPVKNPYAYNKDEPMWKITSMNDR